MNPGELAFLITAGAVAVSRIVTDNDDLTILALALTQLSDTLLTIVEQREKLAKKAPELESIELLRRL